MHDTEVSESGSNGGHQPTVTLDEAHQIVAHELRRKVMEVIQDGCRSHYTRSELVDALVDDVDVDERQLSILLHHVHLPRLAEHEIIEYDRVENDIRYRESPRVERLLDALGERPQ